MGQTPQILLVGDDPILCQVLFDYLGAQGFALTLCHDGEAGLQMALAGGYDLVMLGDALPGMGGIDVLRRIRQQGELPVVMLAAKADDVDCIVGLELGADDYLPKTCNLRELVARLKAILRRTRHAVAAERARRDPLTGLSLSPSDRSASWRGEPLSLTSTEFDLLQLLFEHSGRALTKAELTLKVLGRELNHYDRSLDMHISNLRRKLGKLADGRSPIQTVHGTGYQLLRK